MTTYCILCRQPIPPERQRKKAFTCSNECRKEYRRQYRLELAQRVCRICGRRKRRSRHTEQMDTVPNMFQEGMEVK
jgi:hypothetical protein